MHCSVNLPIQALASPAVATKTPLQNQRHGSSDSEEAGQWRTCQWDFMKPNMGTRDLEAMSACRPHLKRICLVHSSIIKGGMPKQSSKATCFRLKQRLAQWAAIAKNPFQTLGAQAIKICIQDMHMCMPQRKLHRYQVCMICLTSKWQFYSWTLLIPAKPRPCIKRQGGWLHL